MSYFDVPMFSLEGWWLLLLLGRPSWRPRDKKHCSFFYQNIVFFQVKNFTIFWSSKSWFRNWIRIRIRIWIQIRIELKCWIHSTPNKISLFCAKARMSFPNSHKTVFVLDHGPHFAQPCHPVEFDVQRARGNSIYIQFFLCTGGVYYALYMELLIS